MINAILGRKLSQTQSFTEDGQLIPVTEILAGPCTVVQIKTPDHDGYWALQLGFDSRTAKRISKPLKGHFKKTGQGNFLPRFLREVKLEKVEEVDGVDKVVSEKDSPFKIGDQIKVDQVLKVGDEVKVTGISKAKGFQGVVKRHGFAGGPRTHGQSDRERAPGSIGQTTTPGRVYKGKRMAGRMGGKKVTISGLKVVGVNPENNIVTIKGLIPGNKGSLVTIQRQ